MSDDSEEVVVVLVVEGTAKFELSFVFAATVDGRRDDLMISVLLLLLSSREIKSGSCGGLSKVDFDDDDDAGGLTCIDDSPAKVIIFLCGASLECAPPVLKPSIPSKCSGSGRL